MKIGISSTITAGAIEGVFAGSGRRDLITPLVGASAALIILPAEERSIQPQNGTAVLMSRFYSAGNLHPVRAIKF